MRPPEEVIFPPLTAALPARVKLPDASILVLELKNRTFPLVNVFPRVNGALFVVARLPSPVKYVATPVVTPVIKKLTTSSRINSCKSKSCAGCRIGSD